MALTTSLYVGRPVREGAWQVVRLDREAGRELSLDDVREDLSRETSPVRWGEGAKASSLFATSWLLFRDATEPDAEESPAARYPDDVVYECAIEFIPAVATLDPNGFTLTRAELRARMARRALNLALEQAARDGVYPSDLLPRRSAV
jgi:hypothetical protein